MHGNGSKIDFKTFKHKYTIKAYKSQINALKRVLWVYNQLQPNTAGTETGLYMDILSNENIIKLNHGAQLLTYEDIQGTIEAVADNNGIQDIRSIKQGEWKSILTEASKVLFPKGCLLCENDRRKHDIPLVNQLASIYIHLSQKYNKYVNLTAFGCFANIPFETLREWADGDRLSEVSAPLIQKIKAGQADSITDGLFDSSNVTGKMMLANNVLGWNTSRNQTETTHTIERVSTIETDFLTLLDGQN